MAKTIEEFKKQVAKKYGYVFWTQLNNDCDYTLIQKAIDEVVKLYANQKLEQAVECATFEVIETAFMQEEVRINKQSILNLREEI